MALTKEQILGQTGDRPVRAVEVPEWGGTVYVRTLKAVERDAFEAENARAARKQDGSQLVNLRARLAALTVCDESGQRLFSDIDAVELGQRSGAVLDRIFDAATSLNGMGPAAVEEARGN